MTERRKTTRQDCQLPLNIIQVGSRETDWLEQTRNISSNGGVCFCSSRRFELGERIQYTITLSKTGLTHIELICQGVIVRGTPVGSGPADINEIAVTMERYRFARPGLSEPWAGIAVPAVSTLSPAVGR